MIGCFILDLENNFERIKGVICSVVSPNEITSIDDIDVEPMSLLDEDYIKPVMFIEKGSVDYNKILSILSNIVLDVRAINIKLMFIGVNDLNRLKKNMSGYNPHNYIGT